MRVVNAVLLHPSAPSPLVAPKALVYSPPPSLPTMDFWTAILNCFKAAAIIYEAMKGVYEKAAQVVAAIYEKVPQFVAAIYKAARVIAAIYEKMPQVIEAIYEKAAQVVAAIYEMMPQVVAAIYKAADVVAAIYEKAAQVVAAIYEKLGQVFAAIYKVAQVVVAIWGFAKGHPVLCTSIVLGILVILAPFVIKALGFGELGPIEGTVAAGWQSKYRGSVPAGSSFSFLQRRGMKLRRK